MCTKACYDFGSKCITETDIKGKSVIEVGSYIVNASLRSIVEPLGPAEYVGVDIQKGPGVDVVCDSSEILHRFGAESFDVLISTEMLEHVRKWRETISNFKQVLKPGGIILLTTRSKGFLYHGYPYDFWRYEISDMRTIFSDFNIESIESDPEPGVLMKARKPKGRFVEADLSNQHLFSIVMGRRTSIIMPGCIFFRQVQRAIRDFISGILPPSVKQMVRRIFLS